MWRSHGTIYGTATQIGRMCVEKEGDLSPPGLKCPRQGQCTNRLHPNHPIQKVASMMELGLRAEDPRAVALMRLTSCQGEMEAIHGLDRKRSHRHASAIPNPAESKHCQTPN